MKTFRIAAKPNEARIARDYQIGEPDPSRYWTSIWIGDTWANFQALERFRVIAIPAIHAGVIDGLGDRGDRAKRMSR